MWCVSRKVDEQKVILDSENGNCGPVKGNQNDRQAECWMAAGSTCANKVKELKSEFQTKWFKRINNCQVSLNLPHLWCAPSPLGGFRWTKPQPDSDCSDPTCWKYLQKGFTDFSRTLNREEEFLRTWYREGGLRSRIHKRSHPTPMLQCSWKPSQEVDHYLLAKQDGVYQMQVRWGASLRCKVNDTALVIFDDSWSRHTCPKCHNVGLLLSFIWHREFLPTNQLKWAHLDNQLSQTSTHLRGKFSCFENIFFWYFKVQFAHILVLENQ